MEISEFVIYADHVKEGKPHMKGKPGTTAWINNNPGNLSGNKEDVGQIRGKLNWHRFLIFPTPDAGYDAIPKWLKATATTPSRFCRACVPTHRQATATARTSTRPASCRP